MGGDCDSDNTPLLSGSIDMRAYKRNLVNLQYDAAPSSGSFFSCLQPEFLVPGPGDLIPYSSTTLLWSLFYFLGTIPQQ